MTIPNNNKTPTVPSHFSKMSMRSRIVLDKVKDLCVLSSQAREISAIDNQRYSLAITKKMDKIHEDLMQVMQDIRCIDACLKEVCPLINKYVEE